MEKDVLVYDVEVLKGPQEVEGGWNNPHAMGFGTAVVYRYKDDRYYFFDQHERFDMVNFLTDRFVVSFNGVKFDNHVMVKERHYHTWENYDILLEVVKNKFRCPSVEAAEAKFGQREVHDGSCSLDGLSQGTFSMGKTGHGAHAPELIRQKNWAAVYSYNLHDVRLTRKLFEFIRQYGYLIDKKGDQIKLNKDVFRKEQPNVTRRPSGSLVV